MSRADVWQKATQEFRGRIENADWDLIGCCTSPEAVKQLVDKLATGYRKSALPRFLERCNHIIDNLRPFMAAVDVFVQSDPTIASLVWGSIRSIIGVGGVLKAQPLIHLIVRYLPKCATLC